MATLSQFGIPGSGTGILQPKIKNRFQIMFIGIGGIGTNITRQVVSGARPSLSFEEIPLHRYNTTAYVAAKHSWEDLTLTIEDDLTGLAATCIQTQLELQQRIIGADAAQGQWLNAAATAAAYKFATRIEMLDGNQNISEMWNLEGCWLKSVNWGDIDYAASESVTIELTVRFDHASQTLNPGVVGTTGINATSGFLTSSASFNATAQ